MDLIDRQAAIEAIDAVFPVDPMKSEYAQGIACGAALAKTYVEQLPPAQPDNNRANRIIWAADGYAESAQLGTNLAEEYARAVRNWLVNYQVKCADLAGRYTPYEVLGWIVSDWRKENGIW